jgi:hypothetical protein
MGISIDAASAFELFKKCNDIRGYWKEVEEAIDEDTRPGTILNAGFNHLLEIAGDWLGASFTSHPCFPLYKTYIDVLAQLLNTSSNLDRTRQLLNSAIRSAEAAAILTRTLSEYNFKKSGLKLTYAMTIAGSVRMQKDALARDPRALKDMQAAGQTLQTLQATTAINIYEWRAAWCDLYLDSVQLLALARYQLRETELAMWKLQGKKAAFAAAGTVGILGNVGIQRERDQLLLNRLSSGGDLRVVDDPAGYAREKEDEVEKVTDAIGFCCGWAMDAVAATDPNAFLNRIGNR